MLYLPRINEITAYIFLRLLTVQRLTWSHVLDYHNFLEHRKMSVLKFIVYHQTIVPATETSYKMASTRQKWFQKISVFCQETQILYISECTISFKFRQHVDQIRIK